MVLLAPSSRGVGASRLHTWADDHAMKEIEQLRREMRRRGWRISTTGSGHLLWRGPGGERVVTSLTPSNKRAIKQIRADLRRETRMAEEQRRPKAATGIAASATKGDEREQA